MKRVALWCVVGTLVALLPALLAPPSAQACTCAPAPAAEHVAAADAVVVGTIAAVESTAVGGTMSGDTFRTTVDVEQYLKGSGPDTIDFRSPVATSACGFIVTENRGDRYLLFLDDNGDNNGGTNGFTSNTCMGNARLDDDDSALAAVTAVTGAGSNPDSSARRWQPWALGILAGAVLLAGAVYVLVRTRE